MTKGVPSHSPSLKGYADTLCTFQQRGKCFSECGHIWILGAIYFYDGLNLTSMKCETGWREREYLRLLAAVQCVFGNIGNHFTDWPVFNREGADAVLPHSLFCKDSSSTKVHTD